MDQLAADEIKFYFIGKPHAKNWLESIGIYVCLCSKLYPYIYTYSEDPNNSSELLLIFGNFLQQNGLIMV